MKWISSANESSSILESPEEKKKRFLMEFLRIHLNVINAVNDLKRKYI